MSPSTMPRGARSTLRNAASESWNRTSGSSCGRVRSNRLLLFEDLHWVDSEGQALLQPRPQPDFDPRAAPFQDVILLVVRLE